MPTYEYLCRDCAHHFEEFQSITADPVKTCPKCNGAVERLISVGTGLIFKGSGFYITDYKKSNGAKSATPATSAKADKKESKTTTPAKE